MACFHAYANGRKRKSTILHLQSDQGLLLSQGDIARHIYEYFVGLLGTTDEKKLCIREDLWDPQDRVSPQENESLALSFLPEEVDAALMGMKKGTAPGPDGWPVEFFCRFWPMLRPIFLEIVNGFALGTVDVFRLNFGVISLIPKVKGADSVKLFRPIILINVPFKTCAKAYATRLTPVAQRVILKSQTAFLKGRNILEGLSPSMRSFTSLKLKSSKGCCSSLTSKKPTTVCTGSLYGRCS